MTETQKSRSFLRLQSVLLRTALSRSMLYALIKEGAFPPPVNIGERAVGWVEDEVDDWVDSCIARRKATGTNA